jgi:glycine/D-amino acid oxidase-like deaminating enzyme
MHPNAVADRTADASTGALIVGDGVIGLATAFALSQAGVDCRVLGSTRDGAASGAAAGLLAPSVGQLRSAVHPFFAASLGEYPAFVERLASFEPGLHILTGLVEVLSAESNEGQRDTGAVYLASHRVAELEPSLLAPHGALLHEHDGAVDNGLLVRALRAAAIQTGAFRPGMASEVVSVHTANGLSVTTSAGERISAHWIVLAAGAWTPAIAGLPRSLPIEPLKGQMLALAGDSARPLLHHPIMGQDVYIVPRDREIVIGATAEHVGFDTTVNPERIQSLRRSACEICPALADLPVSRAWAGIRPATPDMLPIIGRDPDVPQLLYACGHSKNGILLAPATARAITEIVTGNGNSLDASEFSISRFDPGARRPLT